MRRILNNKRKGIALLIIIVLILTIIVSVYRIQPETEAQSTSTSPSTIEVTYLPGTGGTITVTEASAAEITYVEAVSAIKSTRSNVEEYTISEEGSIDKESISNENLDNEEQQEIDEEEEIEKINTSENDTTINESSENNIPNEDINPLDNEINAADETTEELMAMSADETTSNVKSVTVTHEVKAKQTCGEYDYTDGKIVLMENGDNGITFNGGKIRYSGNGDGKGKEYDRVLTGYKLVSVTKRDRTVITNFTEPENQNYADKTNAEKDIGTVYAQNGWYIVPDDVVEITVEAVYGRAIYIRSPYDKMYYDDYHIFYYGVNNDGKSSKDGTAVEKSSDSNDGTSPDKAVSTLKRAYELIDNGINNQTVYDTVFVLCGDLYDVSYAQSGDNTEKSAVKAKADEIAPGLGGTYKNYSSKQFGYNYGRRRQITIASEYGKKYNFIYSSPDYNMENWSSLRLDNVKLRCLSADDIKDRWNSGKKYPMTRQFEFAAETTWNDYFETTENFETPNESTEIRFKNAKNFRLNGGKWNVVYSYENAANSVTEGSYVYLGGLSYCDYITTSGQNNKDNSEKKLTDPYSIIVTGGRFKDGIYGTGKAQKRLCCRKC